MKNFVTTTISADSYQTFEKLGSKYIVRINPVTDGDSVTCVECMVDSEPIEADIDAIKTEYDAYILPMIKSEKVAEIDVYDVSSNVNAFSYSGNEMWLDKATRNYIKTGVEASISQGKESYPLWYNDMLITLPCDTLLGMLDALEVYAVECYSATAQHKANVNALTTVDTVKAYDYTTGYPDKLSW